MEIPRLLYAQRIPVWRRELFSLPPESLSRLVQNTQEQEKTEVLAILESLRPTVMGQALASTIPNIGGKKGPRQAGLFMFENTYSRFQTIIDSLHDNRTRTSKTSGLGRSQQEGNFSQRYL